MVAKNQHCYNEVMIAFLSGQILEKTQQFLIVVQGGVGYKVFVTPKSLEAAVGDQVKLYTYLKSSDDGQTLFGLPDFASLQFFELLITVTGVGPKVALAILSASSVDMLSEAIANQDSGIFTRISGVGNKTAEHIIIELKSKMATLPMTEAGGSTDVFDGLIGLGYNSREVREVVQKIDRSKPTEEQLKQAHDCWENHNTVNG